MSRSRERSHFMLRAALLFCIACGDGILVARELEPEDEASSDESKPEEHEPNDEEEIVSGRHRVGPRPTRRSPRHRADFAKVHLRDAGSHALDD